VLQQALRDTAELNIHMVGAQLSANGGSVLIDFNTAAVSLASTGR